jgi:two-component system osmolarity sensor histidine kinase EnvZ
VTSITRNVEHADRLIGSFLDFVRVGMLPLDERIDLAATVRAAADAFGRRGADLGVEMPPTLWLAQCNALLIDRLVFNLVDNAFKHGRAPVTVRLRGQPGAVLLDVIDRGSGIAAAGGTRLLDAFARGDPSRHVPGVGLGLAVVQQIVQRLQGELQFVPLPDGHAVRITLPQRG